MIFLSYLRITNLYDHWLVINYLITNQELFLILLTHSDNGETECYFKATIFTIKFLIYKSIVNHLSTYQIR